MKTCALCGRGIPPELGNRHHLIPKGRGGTHSKRNLVFLHKECHLKIHSVISVDALAKKYYTIDKLLEYDEIKRYIKWVKNRPVK
jgi:5-methylcytosine-specific restriction endonuclease McrA